MTHANRQVKDHIKDADTMCIGWYSPTAEKMGGNIYIYQTPDGKGEMRLTSVTKLTGNKPIWKDTISRGEVGKFVRSEKIKRDMGTKLNFAGF